MSTLVRKISPRMENRQEQKSPNKSHQVTHGGQNKVTYYWGPDHLSKLCFEGTTIFHQRIIVYQKDKQLVIAPSEAFVPLSYDW